MPRFVSKERFMNRLQWNDGFLGAQDYKYGYKLWGSEVTGDWIRVKKMGKKESEQI